MNVHTPFADIRDLEGVTMRGIKALGSEHEHQVTVVQWSQRMAKLSPAYAGLGLLFAVPNAGAGGRRGQAGKMRAEGVQAGVPDLFLPVSRSSYHGLALEMKRPEGGRLSPAQVIWHERLRAEGYAVAVCHGADAAIETLTSYIMSEWDG